MSSTFLVSIFLLLASAINFIAQIVYFRLFGIGIEMDLYYLLLAAPMTIVGIMPVLVSSVLIPFFSKKDVPNHSIDRSIYNLFKCVIVFSVAFSGLGMLVTFFSIINDYYLVGPSLRDVALKLIPLIWIGSGVSIISSYFGAALNYKNDFYTPAWVLILPSIFMATSALIFSPYIGVLSIGVGFIAGYILQSLVLYRKFREKVWQGEVIKDKISSFRPLASRFFFVMASLLPFTILPMIAYQLAFSLPIGSISALGYAQSFAGILSVAASMGAATVRLPALASAYVQGEKQQQLIDFESTLKNVLIAVIFFGAAIIALKQELVSVIYSGNGSGGGSSNALISIIPWYILAALFISGINILRTIIFSRNEQGVLALFSIMVIAGYFFAAKAFKAYFAIHGLAAANALAFATLFFLALGFIKGKETSLFTNNFYISLLKTLMTSLISVFMLILIINNINLSEIAEIILGLMIYSVVFYIVAVNLFKIEGIIAIGISAKYFFYLRFPHD